MCSTALQVLQAAPCHPPKQARAPGLLCAQARLSERNVVELVSKLQELGFLDGDLLHSINGREYLTPEHLRAEVLQAVERSGGRVAVVRSSTRCKYLASAGLFWLAGLLSAGLMHFRVSFESRTWSGALPRTAKWL